ncbi:MAG: hypothetical protein VX141_01145, partial [Bacteroidota bacterium]|nr:hypothetical protein [Bacteroidota bacterium]
MKLFKILFLFHFLLIGNSIISQVNIDSLRSIWNDTTQADTNRLKAIHKIASDCYLFTKPDSSFYFAQMHYDFALKVGDKKN